MKEELQLELEQLNSARGMFDSDEFQKFVYQPLQEELSALKSAYDCKSLEDLARVKGKKDGLMVVLNIVEGIKTQIENKKFELDAS